MAKKNQKNQKQPEQQPTPPTAPATPLELSEEELEQAVGGSFSWGANETPAHIGFDGLPTVN